MSDTLPVLGIGIILLNFNIDGKDPSSKERLKIIQLKKKFAR